MTGIPDQHYEPVPPDAPPAWTGDVTDLTIRIDSPAGALLVTNLQQLALMTMVAGGQMDLAPYRVRVIDPEDGSESWYEGRIMAEARRIPAPDLTQTGRPPQFG